MKLTRKQFKAIGYALTNAERAQAFLMRADVAVARKGGQATTTLHYARADGSTMYEIDKEIGSDLCGLQNAIAELRCLIGGAS